MAQYKNQYGQMVEIGSPELNPELVKNLTPLALPKTISSSVLGSTQNPLNPVQPVPVPASMPIYTPPPVQSLSKEEQNISDIVKALGTEQTQDVEKTAFTAEQQEKYQIPELTKTQNDLTAQLTALQAHAKSIPDIMQQQAEGRGITAGGLEPLTAGELRKTSIQANIIIAQLAAVQGNLATAQYNVDRAVQMKFGPLEEDIKAKQANLATLLQDPAITKAEKDRANAQAIALKDEELKIANQKQNQTDIWNVGMTAAQNIQNFKPTEQYATASQALQAIQNAPTKEAALQIALATGLTKPPTTIAGVSPETLTGMLSYYQTTGQIPPMGFGSPALRNAFWQAVGSKGGSFASEAAANKAGLAAATSALRAQQTQLGGAQTSIATLDKQLSLMDEYSDKVDRAGSPFLNKYILFTKGQIAGDADTKAFQNIVKTASSEFAKILSGSAASIAGATVSSQADAENLINSNLNPIQLKEIIGLMKQESQFRLSSQKDTIQQIRGDIQSMTTSGAKAVGGDDPLNLGL